MHAHYLLLCIMKKVNYNSDQAFENSINKKSLGLIQGSW